MGSLVPLRPVIAIRPSTLFNTVLLAFTIALPIALAQTSASNPRPFHQDDYGNLALTFTANQGQVDPRVKFISSGSGYTLFLTDQAAILSLAKSVPASNGGSEPTLSKRRKADVVSMELSGVRHAPRVMGTDQLPGTANYFIGNDPAKWHTHVPTYAKVQYSSVYPGINLVYYGDQRQLEYDFVIAPHADPLSIRLHFAGARRLKMFRNGDLSIHAPDGDIVLRSPVIYQMNKGQRHTIDGRLKLLAGNSICFAVGPYDHTHELVIDPVLSYSTYLGGTGLDSASAIAIDKDGSAYVTGSTSSPNFPVRNPYQAQNSSIPNGVAFVSKLNSTGTALLYSTYLGGTNSCNNYDQPSAGDYGAAIAVDSAGSAYVTGQACSTDFPTTKGAFQTTNHAAAIGSTNGFVTKLDPSGSSLAYSTYLGGSGYDIDNFPLGDATSGIALDSAGDAYVVGTANSNNYPITSTAFQSSNLAYPEGTAATITKLNPTGSALVYSTYLGGPSGLNGSSFANGIAVDQSDNFYVTGGTASTSFPVTRNAFQSQNNSNESQLNVNVFVSKFNTAGTTLLYSTYLGGSGCYGGYHGDFGQGIAVDAWGNAYIAGSACSADFPVTPNAFQTTNKNENLYANSTTFVSKIDTNTGALEYSTYLGGSGGWDVGGDYSGGLAIDGTGSVYVTGYTYSIDFPVTSDAYQSANRAGSPGPAPGSSNAFLSKLDPTLGTLLYSTYLGGTGYSNGEYVDAADGANGIALDDLGNPSIAGFAYSDNFPTTKGVFQPASHAASNRDNAFVAKFVILTPTKTTLVSDANPQQAGTKVTFTAHVTDESGNAIPTGFVVGSIDGAAEFRVALDDTGHASYSTSSLPAGKYTITATYGRTDINAASSATLVQTITAGP